MGRPQRPGLWLTLALCVVAVMVLGAVGWLGSLAMRGRAAQQHLVAAREALTTGLLESTSGPNDTRAALEQVASVCSETAQADGLLRDVDGQLQSIMPLVQAVQSVPVVGSRTRAQTAVLEAGTQLAAAGSTLCNSAQPLVGLLGGSDNHADNSVSSAHAALDTILGARSQLATAADRLDRALQFLGSVSDDDLDPSVRAEMNSLRTRLPALVQTLRDTIALLDLLGASGEHHFLLVSQNPDELRATGGYIGSAGLISIADGSFRLVEYGSSRLYDTPSNRRAQTPVPFDKYLGEYWQFAGANWWASFPDVARQLSYFYSLSRPDIQLDGVVAVDQFALQRLLEVLGPVDVAEYSERVAASDLQAVLDRHVHAGNAYDELGRKQFTGALSAAVLQQVLNAPKAQLPGLVQAMRTSLEQQHLLVAVWESKAAAVLARHHWDGAVLPANQDSLMVVDTDVVASKQSQAISRDVAYEVSLDALNGALARTTITYTNRSEPKPNVQYIENYRTFVRVYVPSGAVLQGSQGFSDGVTTENECGRSVFAGEVVIPRAATVQVALSYLLPPTVVSKDGYDLLIQQQPGAPPGEVSVLVNRADGLRARAMGENASGRNYRWQLANAANAEIGAAPLPEPGPGGCGTPIVAASPIAAPIRLEIPSARITATVVDLGVQPDGSMEAPPTPDVVGWYRMSARAGQPGNSVLAGHVDWGLNTAVFWGLRNLMANDPIIVRGADDVPHRYTVEWNRVFSRSDASAADFVRGTNDAILTLITCEGTYDRLAHDYSARRIVRATLSD